MIGNKISLIELYPKNLKKVIFGDGGKGKVLVIGTLKVPRIPRLEYFFPN